MKKNSLFVFSIILLISCHNNNIESVEYDYTNHYPRLASCIDDAFAYFIKTEDDRDTSIYYMMIFLKGESGFPEKDTILYFCKFCMSESASGFKGLTHIGDYKLLVFDKHDVGTNFYNIDSLKKIDLSGFGMSASNNIIDCCAYVIDGCGYLMILGVQPDDFEPIKIDRE